MKKVFVSYASDDSDFARHLVGHLREAEIFGWMDSGDIASGEAIGDKIKDLITSADVMVALVSPRSINNQWVQVEIGAAWALKKPVVIVLVGGADPKFTLPAWISGFSFLDARNRPMQDVAIDVAQAIAEE